MLKIAHRINTTEALDATPRHLGVEMDLHAFGNQLTVHHDAFAEGISFERWLDHYRHAFVILNIKEEGIETRAREIVLARGIEDFFMLDLSFPALIKMTRAGEKRVAVRVSEYEAVASADALKGQAEWVWLDVFRGFPISRDEHDTLRKGGFRICLVSPELHGRDIAEIARMQAQMKQLGCSVDAVCTKYPDLW